MKIHNSLGHASTLNPQRERDALAAIYRHAVEPMKRQTPPLVPATKTTRKELTIMFAPRGVYPNLHRSFTILFDTEDLQQVALLQSFVNSCGEKYAKVEKD